MLQALGHACMRNLISKCIAWLAFREFGAHLDGGTPLKLIYT